jgi:serine/threonine protein kinase
MISIRVYVSNDLNLEEMEKIDQFDADNCDEFDHKDRHIVVHEDQYVGKGGSASTFRTSAGENSNLITKVIDLDAPGNHIKAFHNEWKMQMEFAKIQVDGHRIAPRVTDVWTCKRKHKMTGYICMEFVKGTTLSKILGTDGSVHDHEKACAYVAQRDAFMPVIYARNMAHGDLNRENILITNENKMILIDYGRAHTVSQLRRFRHTRSKLPRGLAKLNIHKSIDEATDMELMRAWDSRRVNQEKIMAKLKEKLNCGQLHE